MTQNQIRRDEEARRMMARKYGHELNARKGVCVSCWGRIDTIMGNPEIPCDELAERIPW